MDKAKIVQFSRNLYKLYAKKSARLCAEFGISRLEMDVLAFLNNNPQFNTAKDVSEMRLIPKSNVSVAVDALIGKGFLSKTADPADGRVMRLALSEQSAEVTGVIATMQDNFLADVFTGFSNEERKTMDGYILRIERNAFARLSEAE